MEYREYGKTGLKLSTVGFGVMRLYHPDIEESVAVLREAMKQGVNIYETCRHYGDHEVRLGKALKGYRDKVYISSKGHYGEVEALKKDFETSLKILDIEYFDFYQLWGLADMEGLAAARQNGVLDQLRDYQAQGLCKHIGFTSHGQPENVVKLVESGEFASVTVPLSLIYQRTLPVVAAAKKKGVGVMVMTPLMGGVLANPSTRLKEKLSGYTSAEFALRWLASLDGVGTVLSGIGQMSDLEENLKVGDGNRLSPEEMMKLDEVIKEFSGLDDKFCTGCGYCTPCPQEVAIPYILKFYNQAKAFGLVDWAKEQYNNLEQGHGWAPGMKADKCTECGECEEKCPHGVPIREKLKEMVELME